MSNICKKKYLSKDSQKLSSDFNKQRCCIDVTMAGQSIVACDSTKTLDEKTCNKNSAVMKKGLDELTSTMKQASQLSGQTLGPDLFQIDKVSWCKAGLSPGAIAGIVIGSVAFVVIVGFLIKSRKKLTNRPAMSMSMRMPMRRRK